MCMERPGLLGMSEGMSAERVRAGSRIAAQRKASTFVEEAPQDADLPALARRC